MIQTSSCQPITAEYKTFLSCMHVHKLYSIISPLPVDNVVKTLFPDITDKHQWKYFRVNKTPLLWS